MTQIILTTLFYCFSAVLIFSGTMVVVSRNAVRAALFLVLAFTAASALWILLEAEFLALILLLVYVGAVMTLFLFMIMMLNIEKDQFKAGLARHFLLGLTVVAIAVLMIVTALGSSQQGIMSVALPDLAGAHYSNTQALGEVLYTHYLFAFEVAGALLLTAMIAAIALTHRKQRNSLKQIPDQQIRVKRDDRVRLVKMPPVKGGDA